MSTLNLSNLSYLLIDDDPKSRKILKTILEKTIGASKITILDHPEQFEPTLKEMHSLPDVIFFDLMMEPLSGFDLLAILQRMNRPDKVVSIAVTARVMSHDIELMQNAGFHGLISKPIVRQVFRELLERIVAGENLWYTA